MAESSPRGTASTSERSGSLSIALGALTMALVLLVALGSRRPPTEAHEPLRLLPRPASLGLLLVVLVGGVLAGLVVVVYVMWGGAGRRRKGEPEWQDEPPPIPWWSKVLSLSLMLVLVGGIGAVLVFVALQDRQEGPETIPSATGPTQADGPSSSSLPGETTGDDAAPSALYWWTLAAVSLVVLGAGGLLFARPRTRDHVTATPPSPSVPEDDLHAVIVASIDDLEREPDARRAVIRAYVGMEQVLAGHGLGRFPYESPVEYLLRWLVNAGASRASGELLTSLFERARFSPHDIDREMQRQAIGALAAIRDELQGHRP